MTSTREKGNKYERMVRTILDLWGYMTERAYGQYVYTGHGIRSIRHDFFGCVDIIAKNDLHTRYVQVTDVTHLAAHRDKMLLQIWPRNDMVEIWAWRGGKAQQFHIHRLDHDLRIFTEDSIVKKSASLIPRRPQNSAD